MSDKPQVLFVCVHNAGRSQMAAAFLSRHGEGRVDVRSAGSAPADSLNPDPAGQPAEAIRPIRDEIEHRVRALLEELLAPSRIEIALRGRQGNGPRRR